MRRCGLVASSPTIAMPNRGTARRSANSDTPRGALDVLVPQHRQGDVLALELAVNLSPIGLDVTPMALLGAGGSKQRRLQRAVGHLRRQWPAQPGTRQSF